jgi:hypothetical protein
MEKKMTKKAVTSVSPARRVELGKQLMGMCMLPMRFGTLDEAVLQRHLEAGGDVSYGFMGETCLLCAVNGGYFETVKLLLAAGAETNTNTEDSGASPLLLAAETGHIAMVTALIDVGADANITSHDGTTPLFMAAQGGHTATVDALLAAGANANATAGGGIAGKEPIQRSLGATPLHVATCMGHAAVVRSLLHAGCEVNAVNGMGNTALAIATANNDAVITRLLMRLGGADPSIVTVHTPISDRRFQAGLNPLEISFNPTVSYELRRVCGQCGKSEGEIEGSIRKCGKW